uniref:Ankyrin repeat and SOCS box containing 16 n=1 Tax=Lates calcarifer TaxID=8187 RepID=A0A4W6CMD3_LATCA
MSKDTFPFTSTSLRSLRLEQEYQEWQNARRALAQRRALTRVRCRDTAVHNTFMCGDMKGVYAVLKDPAMVNALMETVHEEMVWAPEMGMWTLSSKVKQTSALRLAASRGHAGCVEELLFRGAEVNDDPGGSTALHRCLRRRSRTAGCRWQRSSSPLHLCPVIPVSGKGLLLEGGAEVNVRMRESRLTPLHVAAQRGLAEHVELFLSHGADVLATNREGETPLNAACSAAERPSEAGRYLHGG